jgi:hypothetical protein
MIMKFLPIPPRCLLSLPTTTLTRTKKASQRKRRNEGTCQSRYDKVSAQRTIETLFTRAVYPKKISACKRNDGKLVSKMLIYGV